MADSNQEMTVELEAMGQKLDDYLLGDDLYKTITVHAPEGDRLIKMTLGGMLERIADLSYAEVASPVVQQARAALDRARRAMPERYHSRLAREAKSYTDSWNWFLQNCWEGDGRCRADYALEVPIRLWLERLLEEGGDHQALADSRTRLRALDERLANIWEEGDAPVAGSADRHPRDRYWWLYGLPLPQEFNEE